MGKGGNAMTPPDIRAVLTKMQDDMCKGDLDAIYPYYADGIVFHRTPLPDTVGKEANRKGDEAMLTAFTNNRMTIHEIIVEGGSLRSYAKPGYPRDWQGSQVVRLHGLSLEGR